MYRDTVTVFNYHAASGCWYPSVLPNVHLTATVSKTATTAGQTSADKVQVLIRCSPGRAVATSAGAKEYLGPKAYADCDHPAQRITFAPEQDFLYAGAWADTAPVADDAYEAGLYHALNAASDGVYRITSAVAYSLLPHFEIGGM